MDGWVLELESDENKLEEEIGKTLKKIFEEKGSVKSVIPRRNTLEDLFFGDANK
jgi:hypothetical protein